MTRRVLERRTSITASTTRMPQKAAIEEACPDGKELVVRKPVLFCHGGRPRPISILMNVVSSDVATITTTAKIAARRWFFSSRPPATIAVRMLIPIVAKATSTPFSGQRSQPASTAHRSAGSPRLSMLVSGPQSWVTSTATTPKRAKHRSAQLSVVRRGRSSKGLLRGWPGGNQYAGSGSYPRRRRVTHMNGGGDGG